MTDKPRPGSRSPEIGLPLVCFDADGLGFTGHWFEVTNIRIDGVAFYHHLCLRCAAQKDVPLDTLSGNPWPKPGNAKAPRE
jgi:hypothetical protein